MKAKQLYDLDGTPIAPITAAASVVLEDGTTAQEGFDNAISALPQELTEEQKTQAQSNLGLSPKEALFIDMWVARGYGYTSYDSEKMVYLYNNIEFTYLEAVEIYNQSPLVAQNRAVLAYNPLSYPLPIQGVTSWSFVYYETFLGCKAKIVVLKNALYLAPSSYNMFWAAELLERVLGGFIDMFALTSSAPLSFGRCYALKEIKLRRLKRNISLSICSNLENASILYMVSNSATTEAITITLHPDAYARAIADEAVMAALESKPLITLISA